MSSSSTSVIDKPEVLPVPLITLPALAREINDAHRQVSSHARSMLDEARRAGEALIAAKKLAPHGGWTDWLKAAVPFSHSMANDYMKLARAGQILDAPRFSGLSIRQALALIEAPRDPKPSAPSFDRPEAEYALKLKAMADRGGTENERQVAEKKLQDFAERFGMTGAEAVVKAGEVAPEPEALR